MNIDEKKKELLFLIEDYLNSKISVENIYNYSWETIDYFSKNKHTLPPYQDNEKVFWYAIWELQHLSDEEHERDQTLYRTLKEIVAFLKNEKNMPINYSGKRP